MFSLRLSLPLTQSSLCHSQSQSWSGWLSAWTRGLDFPHSVCVHTLHVSVKVCVQIIIMCCVFACTSHVYVFECVGGYVCIHMCYVGWVYVYVYTHKKHVSRFTCMFSCVGEHVTIHACTFACMYMLESWVGPGNKASVWFTTALGDTISEKYTHSENQFINHSGMVVRHSSIPHNWDSIQNNSKQLCILGGGFQALLVFHSTYT